jgi:predicted esterase
VSVGDPPALLIHGESDDVVNVSHARAMADALSAAAVPVTFRKFARRGHADTVAAFAAFAPDKLPVMAEIRKFVGEKNPPRK